MGFFRKSSSDNSSSSNQSSEPSAFDYAKGGRYARGSGERGPITSLAFEYAKGGSLHGLNRNPDGSPETERQAMIREREEAERESRFRR
ncbi:hypothetical protein AB0C76_10800 [Kitasatospora sp. NPDC048722]|uniref:hypothetical protein n=1 Tax=Kitasatospora sp. NPDC048722 TaxID=3155639 RepID=UPI0033C710EC